MIWLDTGLATTLQGHGLPRCTPMSPWLQTHPDRVLAAHRAHVEAGAQQVLTGTFRLLPHLDGRWLTRAQIAISLASQAAGSVDAVWLSIGPCSQPGQLLLAQDQETRERWLQGVAQLAALAKDGLAGVVLETFVDAAELDASISAVRRGWTGPLVACLSPFDGGRLLDGTPASKAAMALRERHDVLVGFNCGGGPADIEQAARDTPGPVWAKPNAGQASSDEVVAALRRLATYCQWVGGCCGVTDAQLRTARA